MRSNLNAYISYKTCNDSSLSKLGFFFSPKNRPIYIYSLIVMKIHSQQNFPFRHVNRQRWNWEKNLKHLAWKLVLKLSSPSLVRGETFALPCPPLRPRGTCLTCANLSEGLRRRMAMRLRPHSGREHRTITCTACTCPACTAVAAAPTAARLVSPLRHTLSATHQSLSTCECSHAKLILMHGLDLKDRTGITGPVV